MKSPSISLCLAAILTTASCFTTPHVISARSLYAGLFLVPSQAKDLEACAYDLMKEAMEEKGEKNEGAGGISRDIASKLTMKPHHNGPVRWARQRLWPFGAKKDKLP
jgi:hypothetical protein